MALRLSIENLSVLPDGGPISFTMDGDRPVDIGRDKHMDWTLPDPTRYISGKHCEIYKHDNGYWLQDLSTNGTFLSGSDHRVRSPHQLRNGDRLIIGHYMIAVAIDQASIVNEAQTVSSAVVRTAASDTWGIECSFPEPDTEPLYAARLLRPAASPAQIKDWIHIDSADGSPLPVKSEHRSVAQMWEGEQVPPAAPLVERSRHPRRGHEGSQREISNPFIRPPAGRDLVEEAVVIPAPTAPSAATSATNGEAHDVGQDFASRIARGASLPDDFFHGRDPEQLTQQIGKLIRLSTESVMALLQARNEAKRTTRSQSQTMVQATENNALKFAPSAEEAMKIMFGPRLPAYLDARRAFNQGFADLKSHQQQTYAAMQYAILALSKELDPTNIEKDARGRASMLGTISSHKSRLWDTHVARWKAGLGREPGAAIDQFMRHFVEYYDRTQRGDSR